MNMAMPTAFVRFVVPSWTHRESQAPIGVILGLRCTDLAAQCVRNRPDAPRLDLPPNANVLPLAIAPLRQHEGRL